MSMEGKIDAILHYIGDWVDDHFGQYVEDSVDDLTNMIKKILGGSDDVQ